MLFANNPRTGRVDFALCLQLSERAKLGQRALKLLKRARAVDDQLTVDIITDAIR